MGNLSVPNKKPAILCVANWDSNVGYAWWLMESFWIAIHTTFKEEYNSLIAYPSISSLPEPIATSAIEKVSFDFRIDSFKDLLRHKEFIKKHNIKVIYFSDRPTNHWSYLFFKLWGVKKIVVHDHTPGVRSRPHGFRLLLKKLRSRIPLLNADIAIGATEYVKNRLIEINCLPAYKCFAAPNGLPETKTVITPINLHQQLHLSPDTLLIVSTGRANIYKGLDFALKVIARLVHQRSIHNLHFIFCGDGPDLDVLEKMARSLNINSNVSFLGRVNNIPQLLPACNIAFHPSRGEVGYSLSILEYMRAGLPVVLSDNPSVCEATTDNINGLIYPENDVDACAEKIITLLSDVNLAKSLGENGARIVSEKYSLAMTHTQLISALKLT